MVFSSQFESRFNHATHAPMEGPTTAQQGRYHASSGSRCHLLPCRPTPAARGRKERTTRGERARGGKGKAGGHPEEAVVEAFQLPLPLPADEETADMAGTLPRSGSGDSSPSSLLSLPSRAGPMDWSFWVLRGRVLAGAYPKRSHLVSDLLKAGECRIAIVTSSPSSRLAR